MPRAPWLHATALALVTLAAWLAPGIHGAALRWDPAYFTYMGQAVQRGERIYAHTFMAYPPLDPLVLALVMEAGAAFDLPTWLTPRYAAVLCGLASVLLLQAVARRATGSAWAGLVAGLALAGFDPLARSYLATLEPKHLVILFTLAAAAASQRERWGIAGAAASLAATSYQPAVWTGAAFGLLAARASWIRRDRSVGLFAAGALVGLLPAVLYLSISGSWADFWVRAVLLPAQARAPGAGLDPLHWIWVLRRFYGGELSFFVGGALGWGLHAGEAARRPAGRRMQAWLAPETGGLPLLTLLWCTGATLEFQGYPDAYPLLPLAAFWFGWLAHRSVVAARVLLPARAGGTEAAGRILAASWVALAAWVAFRELPPPRPLDALSRQRAEVEWIIDRSGGDVVALAAEEVYVLAERPSPLPFLRLPREFQPFLPEAGYVDCADVARRVLADRPRVVALRFLVFSPGNCERLVSKVLRRGGYAQETSPLGMRLHWRDGLPEGRR